MNLSGCQAGREGIWNVSVKPLNDKTLELVAERFRLLGDPLRLRLLQTLERREMAVAGLVAATGASQANVSKHLQLLLRGGLVKRRREGLFVFYSVGDDKVFEICDVVCGSLAEHLARELSSFGEAAAPPRARPTRRGR
jgi:ArsR family transcriptional regulator